MQGNTPYRDGMGMSITPQLNLKDHLTEQRTSILVVSAGQGIWNLAVEFLWVISDF